MAFRNIRLPTGIKYGAIAGPTFSTRRARVRSGRTQRNAQWEFPLRRFQVERALKTAALRRSLFAMFYNVNGDLDTWRLKDWSDYQVLSGEGVFRALGSGRFQLEKRYSIGSVGEVSPNVTYTKDIDILLPVEGTLVIDGLTEGTHWTTDYSTPSGIITAIGSPTPSFSSWTGEYDVLSRFENDELMLQVEDKVEDDALYFETQSITITEERL